MLATPEIIQEQTQLSRLEELLPEWQRVPLYNTFLAQRPVGPDILAAIKEFPISGKREMRQGFPIVPPGETIDGLLEKELVELEHTSGTTEEQLPVLFERGWWDIQEQRALRLNPFVAGVLNAHPDARRATLTTPACNGRVCFSAWRSRAHRTFGRTLYVNQQRIPFVLTDDELARMADEMADWSPTFLDTDPVHAAWFALYCERKGIRLPSLQFILCSYEFVSAVHKRILQRAFGVPVFNLYGSTETGHLLMEDGHKKMKPVHENAFLEIVSPDARGIGDLVERREQPYESSYIVHGRIRDALRDAAGDRVTTWDVDQCFADIKGIMHYQLAQSADGSCHLRYLPDPNAGGPQPGELKTVRARLEESLQVPAAIEAEAVDKLPPTNSGKFRLTMGAA